MPYGDVDDPRLAPGQHLPAKVFPQAVAVAVCCLDTAGLAASMAPATTNLSAGSSGREDTSVLHRAEENECSDSAASSLDHLVPVSSSSPGVSCNETAALVWHDDGDTTDDQDDAGWQLVANKHSHKGGVCASSIGPAKATVCGRCGLKGHASTRCRQPQCTRCSKWWHTEDECLRACQVCGSLEHKISAGTPLCKSYKCRECGLYGHVYAECPNIVCNLCKQVGHKALDCPSIICNLCKQQGHKAVNCPKSKGVQPSSVSTSTICSAGSKTHVKHCAEEQHMLKLQPAAPQQLRQSGSSCGSNTSPTSCATTSAACSDPAQGQAANIGQQDEVPLTPPLPQPATAAELQARQQQQSQLVSQLYKAAPQAAVMCLDDHNRLQALYCIEPVYLANMFQGMTQMNAATQQQLLEAAVQSVYRQLQHMQQQQVDGDLVQQHCQQQLSVGAAGLGGLSLQHHSLRSSASSGSTPASPATPGPRPGSDVDATQGIKPGDLAPQLAKQLVAEFGDMLPNRWQQLPSWRQLEARLSFPDGNYVQRRLQFREKRRQLQLQTLQLRAASAVAKQQQATGTKAPSISARLPTMGMRVSTTGGTPLPPGQAALEPGKAPGVPPSSYAAALAGHKMLASCDHTPHGGVAPLSTASAVLQASGPQVEAISDVDNSSCSIAMSAAALQPEDPANCGIAVCRRCGMMGHMAQHCAQPRCSRCRLWWHAEAQCASACQFCGSLAHQGDAEQPSSCQSFKCKACKMFGHTASTCPHVQLHSLQEKAKQAHLLKLTQEQQQTGLQAHGISPVATPTSLTAVPSSLSSSSHSICFQQTPASPLSKLGSASNGSITWDSPMRPSDSPGLGQHGVKPKDLLPEHAKALQEEFPNALPSGWQQMASWRMVEERLRVVAVEGAVFSKRRQMWRDRRKHYQVLTAKALAAAARSAAVQAAAYPAAACEEATAAVGEDVIAAVAEQQEATAVNMISTAGINQDGSRTAANNSQQLPQVQSNGTGNSCGPTAVHMHAVESAVQRQQQPALHQSGDQRPHQLALLQKKEPDDLVPEWQQHRGSLFGISSAPSPHGNQQPEGGMAQPGSTFSCNTASFCCSPLPAVAPSVLMSHLGSDPLAASAVNTPGQAGTPGLTTPAMFTGSLALPASRHPSGSLQLVPPHNMLTGASPRATSVPATTPMPTPRGAAAAAAALAAAAANTASGVPVSAVVGPYGIAVGELPAGMTASGVYSPVHCSSGALAAPRPGLGCGMPQPQSPPVLPAAPGMAPGACGMSIHGSMSAQAASHPGMNTHPAGHPGVYQQMLVDQRQGQLQQQVLHQSPYAPRHAPMPELSAARPHMMVLMQSQPSAQQQHQQQQAHMQRQRRLEQAFMAQQAGVRHGVTQAEEPGEALELDDKLGVLGVLGLQ